MLFFTSLISKRISLFLCFELCVEMQASFICSTPSLLLDKKQNINGDCFSVCSNLSLFCFKPFLILCRKICQSNCIALSGVLKFFLQILFSLLDLWGNFLFFFVYWSTRGIIIYDILFVHLFWLQSSLRTRNICHHFFFILDLLWHVCLLII